MDTKVTLQEISPYERQVTVEIPFEEIEAEMERQFILLMKNTKLKGFRPGHVPLAVVKQRFSQQVRGESIAALVDRSYAKAITDHNLVPVSHPRIELKPHEDAKAMSYVAHVEIKPSVEVKHYQELCLEKEKIVIKESDVTKTIEQLRLSKAHLKSISEPRGAQDQDHVVIDFKGTLEGKVFPGGAAQNFLYEIGSHQFVQGFEEGLKGMVPGSEKKIHVTFPDDFHEKRLAGKPVVFDVFLREIKIKEIPELDDTFAKEIQGCKTLSDVKEKVTKDLTRVEEARVRKDLEKKIFEQLIDKNPFEVPPSMIERQFEYLMEDSKRRMRQMGAPENRLEGMLDEWKKDLKVRAEFDIKSVLICEALSKKEKLEINEDELQQELENIANRAGTTAANVRAYYQKRDAMAQLKWQLLHVKVIDWILSKAKIK